MSDDSMQIGRYNVLDELGSGAYATVYRVQDTVLEREMAMKVMHPALLGDAAFVERFRQEARVVAGLRHPHIIVVYDHGEYDDRLCLVMDLLHGGSLADLLEEGPLPWERALAITRQLAEALDYAHGRDLVHRDVKPHNILLDEEGRAVLADFGVVRALESGTVASTMSGGVVGTAAYIPVEIWDGEPPSPRTDVYALACVVYEMITAERLFQGSSLSNTIRRHLRPPEFPEEWPDGTPAGIEKVLAKALAQYPSRRFQSAGAFAEALAAPKAPASRRPATVLREEPGRKAEPAGVRQGTVVAKRRRRWTLTVAALLLAVVLVGGGIFLFVGDGGDGSLPAAFPDIGATEETPIEEPTAVLQDEAAKEEEGGPAGLPATETEQATGKVLFIDDFNSNVNDWRVGELSNELLDRVWSVSSGHLQLSMTSKRPGGIWSEAVIPDFSARNFLLEFDAKFLETSGDFSSGHPAVRVVFRGSNNGFYRIFFDNDAYRVDVVEGEDERRLVDWTRDSAIRMDGSVKNFFAISANDSTVIVLANGQQVIAFDDDTIGGTGYVSLGASLFEAEQSVTVAFDEVVVTGR